MIFLDGSIRDSRTFSKILTLFSSATGMLANHLKSSIILSRTSIQESQLAQHLFPFCISPLDCGLKYLGFSIKPISQKIADWVWLVAKLEKRINICSHIYLSRVGRLVLVKSVLEATPVFWMALAWILRSILSRLHQIRNRYLWNGNQDKRIFAWVGWKKISIPKKWGAWGSKDLPVFAQALAAKIGWKLLIGNNHWTNITYHKYIWTLHLMEWIRLPSWPKSGISSVWKALLNSMPLIRDNLVWKINDGSLARIGIDPWNGSNDRHILSEALIGHLHSHEIKVLADIVDPQNTSILDQRWKSTIKIDLPPHWH